MKREDVLRQYRTRQRVGASAMFAVMLFATIVTAVDGVWVLTAVFGVITCLMLVLVVHGIRSEDT